MYVTKEQAHEIIDELGEFIKQEYFQKSEFLFNLLDDDDWSFVIKSHSLIEAVITELIINKINQQPLKSVIERMPLHGDIVSKVSIAQTYNLLSPEHVRFIKKLSEIRNSIVHKYENINFKFENYILSLDKNNRKNWNKLFESEHTDSELSKKIRAISNQDPKAGVWLILFHFVHLSLLSITMMKSTKLLNEEAIKTSSNLL